MRLLILLITLPAMAGEFANPTAVERAMDNNPASVRLAIEDVCTQEQIDAIEATINPPPSDAEKAELLATAEQLLRRAEHTELADTVAVERERVKPVEPEPEPDPREEDPAEPIRER